ncbi:transposase family protein [Amycolatopsis sp. NPDC004378]
MGNLSGGSLWRVPFNGSNLARANLAKVHRRYPRLLTDLPSTGRRTVLVVRARRFVCADAECPRPAPRPGASSHSRQQRDRRQAQLGLARQLRFWCRSLTDDHLPVCCDCVRPSGFVGLT